jgi:hypothetical protein
MINRGVLLVVAFIFVVCVAIFVGVACLYHYAIGMSFGWAIVATVGTNVGIMAIFTIICYIDCEKFDKSVDK